MTTQSKPTIAEIAENLNAVGVPPLFESEDARTLIALWRGLAEGKAISLSDLDSIAERLGVDRDGARAFAEQISERDDDGNIRGAAGLSLNQHPHRFTVTGNTLSTWCAWDSLFLPPAIGSHAEVISKSPVSGNPIELTVGPDGIVSSSHPDAVVSVILLDPEGDSGSSIEAIYMTFCHQVHFFSDEEEAKTWFEGKDMNVVFLSLDDAFELGTQAFASLLKYA